VARGTAYMQCSAVAPAQATSASLLTEFGAGGRHRLLLHHRCPDPVLLVDPPG
jgi:hypothetical protein